MRLNRVAVFLASLTITAAVATAQPSTAAPATEAGDPLLRAYYAGNGLLNRGQFEAALAEYRKFLSDAPMHEKAPVARYGFVVSLFRLDRCDEAMKEIPALRGAEEFPYSGQVALIAGQCHLIGGRFAQAAEAFAGVIADHGRSEIAADAAGGRCEALFRDGQFEEAVQQCEAVAIQWPQSPQTARSEYFRGLAQMRVGDFGGAAKTLTAYEKAHPTGEFASQIPLLIGMCLERGQDVEGAIERFRRVVKSGDRVQTPEALLGLGLLLQRTGQLAEASKTFDALLADHPDSPGAKSAVMPRAQVWFEQGEYSKAFTAFERAAQVDPSLAPNVAYWLAKCDLRQGKVESAAKRFAKAIGDFPQHPQMAEMKYDLAICHGRQEECDAALKQLRSFLAAYPNHSMRGDALILAAGYEQSAGNAAAVCELCDTFIREFPDHERRSEVEFLAAENEARNDERIEQAIARYRIFLERYPKDERAPLAMLHLGRALFRLGRYMDAEQAFESVASKAATDPQFAPALLALGDMAFQRGEWKTAEIRLGEYLATGADPPSADDALMKRAQSRRKIGRGDDAARDYEQLVAKYPQSEMSALALYEHGQLLIEMGKLNEANAKLKQSLELGGSKPFAGAILGQLAWLASQRGDVEQAARYYEQSAVRSEGAQESTARMLQGRTLMAAGRHAEAEVVFRAVNTSEGRARLAVAILRQDRADESLTIIRKLELSGGLERLDPAMRLGLWYEKAWALRSLKQDKEAADAYRLIVAAKDAGELRRNAMLELADLEAGAKQYESAAVLLRQLHEELSSDSATPTELREQCVYRLGVCEYELGAYAKASALFEQVVVEFPQSPVRASARFYAGEASFRAGRVARAAEIFTAFLDENAPDEFAAPGLLRLGECHATLQKWALSEEVFQKFLERFPKAETWYQAQFGVGWSRENQRRYDDAIAAYEKVTTRHQGATAARAQFQIGQCLFAQKKLEPAIRELLKVEILYAYPEWSAAALFEAGRCFAQLNDPIQARQQFSAVVENYKDTKWAVLARKQLEELTLSAGALPGK